MKRVFAFIFLFLSPAVLAYGKYQPWTYNMVEATFYRSFNGANGSGKSINDDYLELEGFHRYKLLDLYWFHDFFDIFDSHCSDMHGVRPSFYGEFNPRISIDGLVGRDLSFWRFTEWFVSYEFDYDNGDYRGGLQRHQIGIGSYFDLKGFDYVRLNLFTRYATHSYGKPNENKWDGYLFNVSYSVPLHEFRNGWRVVYSGWMDFVFGARQSKKYINAWNGTRGTDTSLQWYNQLTLEAEHFGVSVSVKLNNNFTEVEDSFANASDATQFILGIHYKY